MRASFSEIIRVWSLLRLRKQAFLGCAVKEKGYVIFPISTPGIWIIGSLLYEYSSFNS